MAENLKDQAEDVAEEGKETLGGHSNGTSVGKKFLLPAAAGLGTLAAGYAAKKGPELVKEHLMPKLEDRGSDEAAKIGKQAVDKVKDGSGVGGKLLGMVTGGGDGGGSHAKKTRRLPIQRWTDVAVPVEQAYAKWIEFEEYPSFMHRVLSVEKKGRDRVQWREKIWFSKREWEGRITDRRKNDRIAWKTTSGTQHSGVVSFHKIGDNLTRVMVTVDFHPTGMIEKLASGLRFVKRAVQSDLARFKAYVELGDAKALDYGNEEQGQDDKEQSDENGNGNGNGAKGSDELERSRSERAERRKERRA